MTLIDINNQIVEHFLQNERFSIQDDLSRIRIPEEYVEFSEQLVIKALEDLSNNGLLVALNKDVFILKQPINNIIQNLQLSPNIASAIADKCNMIKDVDDSKEEDGDITNALNIQERDIVKLLMIIDFLLENVDTNKKGDSHNDE